jgi:hypothetical protein
MSRVDEALGQARAGWRRLTAVEGEVRAADVRE